MKMERMSFARWCTTDEVVLLRCASVSVLVVLKECAYRVYPGRYKRADMGGNVRPARLCEKNLPPLPVRDDGVISTFLVLSTRDYQSNLLLLGHERLKKKKKQRKLLLRSELSGKGVKILLGHA